MSGTSKTRGKHVWCLVCLLSAVCSPCGLPAQDQRDAVVDRPSLADRSHFSNALCVAAMPPKARTSARVILVSAKGDSHTALVGLDANGQKSWERLWAVAPRHVLAADEKHCWFTFQKDGIPYLTRVDPNDGSQVPFRDGLQGISLLPERVRKWVEYEIPEHPELAGRFARKFPGPRSIAVLPGRVALLSHSGVQLYDSESGKRVGAPRVVRVRRGGPKQIGCLASGQLIGIAGRVIREADLGGFRVVDCRTDGFAFDDDGNSQLFEFPESFVLRQNSPHTFALDSSGRFYFARAGQVVIYDRFAADAKVLAVVGKRLTHYESSRLQSIPKRDPGRFDPVQMSYPVSIAIEERSDGKLHLWCVESNDSPRRVAVWNVTEAVNGAPATLLSPDHP